METSQIHKSTDLKVWMNNFLKKKSNWILLFILFFAVGIRIYYLFYASSQPLWWDEAELMLQANHIAFGTPNTGWFPFREPLLPLIFGFFLKLGATEFFVRFIEITFSITAVVFTYLLSREIFDSKTAIIATSLMSIFYLHLFYSLRFMSEAPTLAFVTMGVYFFWKGYIRQINLKYLILSGLSILIGFLSYYAVGFIGIVIIIFLLISDKFSFIKEKKVWIAILIIALLAMPYMIYSMATLNTPFPRLYAVQKSITDEDTKKVYSAWSYYVNLFPTYLKPVLLVIFLLGLIYVIINIIIGFDMLLKNKHDELQKDLFIFLWIMIPLMILSYVAVNTSGHGEDRYLILIFPAVFLISSRILMKTANYIDKFGKRISVLVLVLVILVVGYQQVSFADSLIKSKISSYEPVKSAGIWIKENSNPNDIVISNSIPQNTYYSQRATYYAFEYEKIKSYNPKYFVVSIFENSGEAYFKLPEQHADEMVPVHAVFADQKQEKPILIVYEFKSS